jgi:hypothetical protein
VRPPELTSCQNCSPPTLGQTPLSSSFKCFPPKQLKPTQQLKPTLV